MSFSLTATGTKAGVAAAVQAANVHGQQLGEIARTAILAAIEQINTTGVEVVCSGHQDASYGNVSIQVAGKVLLLDPVATSVDAVVPEAAQL